MSFDGSNRVFDLTRLTAISEGFLQFLQAVRELGAIVTILIGYIL